MSHYDEIARLADLRDRGVLSEEELQGQKERILGETARTQAQAPPSAAAFTCPRCDAAAKAAPYAQRCPACNGLFTLRAGALVDPAVVPPAPGDKPRMTVRSAGVVSVFVAFVDAHGVSAGTADPIVGRIPMSPTFVPFRDIYSVAVWRRVAVAPAVAAVLLALPLGLLALYGAMAGSAWLLVPALPLLSVAGFVLYRAFAVQANTMRILGRHANISFRFDKPTWRRRRFHDELLRRAGIPPTEIP